MAKKKIYVGCALTHATEEFRQSIERLKGTLRAEGYDVLDFMWVKGGSDPVEIYKWDIEHCVKNCDAFVAIADHPSLGLGFELGEAARLKKPTLVLAHKDALVARIIIGAAEVLDSFKMQRYQDLDKDVLPLVNKWLTSL